MRAFAPCPFRKAGADKPHLSTFRVTKKEGMVLPYYAKKIKLVQHLLARTLLCFGRVCFSLSFSLYRPPPPDACLRARVLMYPHLAENLLVWWCRRYCCWRLTILLGLKNGTECVRVPPSEPGPATEKVGGEDMLFFYPLSPREQ